MTRRWSATVLRQLWLRYRIRCAAQSVRVQEAWCEDLLQQRVDGLSELRQLEANLNNLEVALERTRFDARFPPPIPYDTSAHG